MDEFLSGHIQKKNKQNQITKIIKKENGDTKNGKIKKEKKRKIA